MKKSLITMFAITLWFALVSGVTMSYFTAQSDEIITPFTVGTLQVESLNPQVPTDWSNWSPFSPQVVTWTFKNVGNKSAYLRAGISTQWATVSDQVCTDQSAWAGLAKGASPDAFPFGTVPSTGNQWRYFELLSMPQTMTLNYGANELPMGTVEFKLSQDTNQLIAQVILDPGWAMRTGNAHLHITNNAGDYKLGPPPTPDLGSFNHSDFDYTNSLFTVNLPSANFDVSQPMYVALHLGVKNCVAGSESVITGDDFSSNPTWTQYDPLWQRSNIDGKWYYCPIVLPGQTVNLTFVVSLSPDEPAPLGSDYSIGLTLDAIQTTNGAVDMWPYKPPCP